ncbi:hypothetical protein AC249_AIPGENE19909 [Exaiptasia diaphana]|nr:hypothetical protein AC249_AIPGENE19909 [Exaiptasia diaphana]
MYAPGGGYSHIFDIRGRAAGQVMVFGLAAFDRVYRLYNLGYGFSLPSVLKRVRDLDRWRHVPSKTGPVWA